MAGSTSILQGSALVQWVQTFSSEPITTQDLTEGVFLNEVLQQIDPSVNLDGLIGRVEESADLWTNWDILLRNTLAYFQDVLQQIVIMRPPDIHCISIDPQSEGAREETLSMLQLLLYASVHSERKEEFVERIKELDVDTQSTLVTFIQQVTKQILPVEGSGSVEDSAARNALLYDHVHSLLAQRDAFLQEIHQLKSSINQSENDIDVHPHNSLELSYRVSPTRAGSHSPCGGSISPSASDKQHLAVELAELRAKLRQLREEIDDKNDMIAELQDDLDSFKQVTKKLRNENMGLIQDAKSANSYRDELDILRDKVIHVNKLESESQRLKEKLAELEFYKARVNELRADNDVLLENRRLLEEQISSCHRRIEESLSLESQLHTCNKQLSQIAEERDKDRARIASLMEENSRLVVEVTQRCEADSVTSDEDDASSNKHRDLSLADQLNEVSTSEILRLQLANQQLRAELDHLKHGRVYNDPTQQNLIDCKNIIQANDVSTSGRNSSNDSEDSALGTEAGCVKRVKDLSSVTEENSLLQKSLEAVHQFSSVDVEKLEKERTQLLQIVEAAKAQAAEAERRRQGAGEELEKVLSTAQADRLRCVQLEHELFDRTSEVHRKEQEMSRVTERLEVTRRELSEAESSTVELQCRLSNLEQIREDLVGEIERGTELSARLERLSEDKLVLEREGRRAKKSLEEKERKIEGLLERIKQQETECKLANGLNERNKELEVKQEEIQKENMDLFQKSVLDRNTLLALREDLVKEKIKYQEERDDLERLRLQLKSYEMKEQKQDLLKELLTDKDETSWKNLESRMEQVFQQRIDNLEGQIAQYQNELEEARKQNKDLEERFAGSTSVVEAGTTSDVSEHKPDNTTDRMVFVTQRYIQSPNASKAVNRSQCDEAYNWKNKNDELEKLISRLQTENTALKRQAQSTLVGEPQLFRVNNLSSLREESSRITATQAELAKLQVEKTTLLSQNTSLAGQVHALRSDKTRLEAELHTSCLRAEDSASALESQREIHDTLQCIHDRLSRDYEDKCTELSELKGQMKKTRISVKQLQEENFVISCEKEQITAMKKDMEKEFQMKQRNAVNQDNVQNSYWKVREENFQLLVTNDSLRREGEETSAQLRHCRMSLNQLKQANTLLNGELDVCRVELSSARVELAKLLSHCEVLAPLNVRLEEENESLLSQLQSLMNQNQELLTNLINDKSTPDSRSLFVERLSDVKRQKEDLQEKIQARDQRCDPLNKKSENFAAALMRKARQIVSGKSSREKCSESTDNSSLGSDSFYNATSKPNEDGIPGRNGAIGASSDKSSAISSDSDVLRNQEWSARPDTRQRRIHRTDSIKITLVSSQKNSSSSLSSPASQQLQKVSTGDVTKSPQIKSKAGGVESARRGSDNNEDEDKEITLDEFLRECDNSPKTRRRLMVEKRITLDDDIKKDILSMNSITTPLLPRPPLIQSELRSSRRPEARPSQSEWNISSPQSKWAEQRRQSIGMGHSSADRNAGSTGRSGNVRSSQACQDSNGVTQRVCRTLPRSAMRNSPSVTDEFNCDREQSLTGLGTNCSQYQQYNNITTPDGRQLLEPDFNINRVPQSCRPDYSRRQSLGPSLSFREARGGHAVNSQPNISERQYHRARSVDQHELQLRAADTMGPQIVEMSSQYDPGYVRGLVQSYQDTVNPGRSRLSESPHWSRVSQGAQPMGPGGDAGQSINQDYQNFNCDGRGNSMLSGNLGKQFANESSPSLEVPHPKLLQHPGLQRHGNAANRTPKERVEYVRSGNSIYRPTPIRPKSSQPAIEGFMASRPLPSRPNSVAPNSARLTKQEPEVDCSSQRSNRPDGNVCVVRPASGRSLSAALHEDRFNSSSAERQGNPAVSRSNDAVTPLQQERNISGNSREIRDSGNTVSTSRQSAQYDESYHRTPSCAASRTSRPTGDISVENVQRVGSLQMSAPGSSGVKRTATPSHLDENGRPKAYQNYGCM